MKVYSEENIILITSRILNYTIHPLNGQLITHYTIQPMSIEYLRSFVENWCLYAQEEIIYLFNQYISAFKQNNIKCQLKLKAKNLIQKIETNDKLRSLVSNPSVLSIVCMLFAQHGIDTFDKRPSIKDVRTGGGGIQKWSIFTDAHGKKIQLVPRLIAVF